MSVRVVYHPAVWQRIVRGAGGEVDRDMRRRARNVQSEARARVGRQSGRLANSISIEPYVEAGDIGYMIGSRLSYARIVHDGSGIYGSTGHLIRPTSARVLTWEGPDGRQFARYSRGQRAQQYLLRALPAAAH